MNAEKYNDPTADAAIGHVYREEQKELDQEVTHLIHKLHEFSHDAGFEIIGRVVFRHRKTGKVFR